MKVIAFFVPQYHRIPLNDKYWGEGFTERNNVKSAKPLFEGHQQPRVPLNNNYYNLLDYETKKWQIKIAKDNGIYGFCFYHYWFNGKLLLEKPAEQILYDASLNINFCFSWANEAWTMEWVGKKEIIMPQFYGGREEWEKHFQYLLPFFKDNRYIKENGKPVFVIYRPGSIDVLDEMLSYWDELAILNGFPGMVFMNQNPLYMHEKKQSKYIDYNIEFEPATSKLNIYGKKFRTLKEIKRKMCLFLEKKFGWDIQRIGQTTMAKLTNSQFPSYDEARNNILTRKPYNEKSIPCAFVDWDNSPRYREKAIVYRGSNPTNFAEKFGNLLDKTRNEYKKDMIFVMAWNERGEGGYLEPDTRYKYGYLNAIYNELKKRKMLEEIIDENREEYEK